MTEKRILESLNTAVEEMTPNILEDLMAELKITDEPVELMHDAIATEATVEQKWIPRSPQSLVRWRKTIAGVAAALLIAVTGFTMTNIGKDPFAMVSLDVNPGIELTINAKEKVIDANPVNKEAVEILDEMDLTGSDIDVACNAIVGSMLTHGYLSDLQNSILLSVSAQDKQTGTEIEKRLSENLNSFLENSEIAAAILGQYVESDDSIVQFANTNGISQGKAWLIRNLLKTGSTKMKEADLLKLTTQELILLGQKRGVDKVVSYGNAETSKYIGSDKAISIALEKAGVDRASASYIKHEFDSEAGVLIYEVTFRAGNYEYDYDINAYDGSIIKYEREYEGPVGGSSGGSSGSGSSGSSSGGSTGSGTRVYDDDDDDDYDDRYDDPDDDPDDDIDYDDDDDDDYVAAPKQQSAPAPAPAPKQQTQSYDDDDDDDDYDDYDDSYDDNDDYDDSDDSDDGDDDDD